MNRIYKATMYLAHNTILEIKRSFNFPFLIAHLIEQIRFSMHKDKNVLRNTFSKPLINLLLY